MLFEILLGTFHCSNNADRTKIENIYKVRGLMQLMKKFKMWNTPAENMYIDKSVILIVG